MKIKLYAYGGYANTEREDEFEYPDEDWKAMSKEEQEAFLQEEGWNFAQNCGIDFGAYAEE